MEYPLEFISGENGVTRDSFDYFPEYHYREAYKQKRGQVDDKKLDSWIEEVLGKEPTDGRRHGLWREDVPELVEDLLASSQQYETEITIKPLGRQDGYGYVVEWEVLEFDDDTLEWKPIQGFEESENF